MKVKGLDGREYKLVVTSRTIKAHDARNRSGPHLKARELLKKMFPLVAICEEVELPGTGGLVADFFIPSKKTMIEVQGIQHFKYVPHFHKTRIGFYMSLRRDKRKSMWCQWNGFRLVILPDTEDEVAWQSRISRIETKKSRKRTERKPSEEGVDRDSQAGSGPLHDDVLPGT